MNGYQSVLVVLVSLCRDHAADNPHTRDLGKIHTRGLRVQTITRLASGLSYLYTLEGGAEAVSWDGQGDHLLYSAAATILGRPLPMTSLDSFFRYCALPPAAWAALGSALADGCKAREGGA